MIKEMRIETSRLIIRPYIESDLLESFELMQNKELFKYMDMEVMSFEEYKGLFSWLIAFAKPENIASNRVIQKLGFEF